MSLELEDGISLEVEDSNSEGRGAGGRGSSGDRELFFVSQSRLGSRSSSKVESTP